METFILLCILGLLPISTALNCYQCAAASRGCNDPFNATGIDVSTTGSVSTNIYCKKEVFAGIARRTGETTCIDSKFVLSTGTTCCQKDLCNGARATYQMSILLVISIVTILAKIQ